MRHDTIVDAIGNTPAVRLRVDAAEGVEVYAKLELLNPYAMKDRVARQMIIEARRSGALKEGAPIVESSSGTMALGIALVGTYLGHAVHIVTDPRIDPITLTKLEALGCVVHVVETMTGQGWQSARLERLAELMSGMPGAYWPQQYSNPQNPAAYRTLADELIGDLGTVDVVVGSVGSGGSLCGTSAALLERLPDLKVVGVDCVGSVLFGQPDVPARQQSGLGNSLYPDNIDYRLLDEVHWLSDDEAFDATQRLAREQKIFAGNTSGSVYRILTHLAAEAVPGTRLVGILPDRGDRYADSVYRHRPVGPIAARPAEVPYGTTVTGWSFASIPRRNRPVLVFVESNTTGTGMLALRTAVRLGFEPVLLAKDPARYAGLDGTGCLTVACDTESDADVLRAVREAAGKRTIAGLTTTSDFYLEHTARLAAALGLPGHPPETVAVRRDKSLTRTALRDAGVPQPAFAVIDDPMRHHRCHRVRGRAVRGQARGRIGVAGRAVVRGRRHGHGARRPRPGRDRERSRPGHRPQGPGGGVRARPGIQRGDVLRQRGGHLHRGDPAHHRRAALLRRDRPCLPHRAAGGHLRRTRGVGPPGAQGGGLRPRSRTCRDQDDGHGSRGHRDQRQARRWHDPRTRPYGDGDRPSGAAGAGRGRVPRAAARGPGPARGHQIPDRTPGRTPCGHHGNRGGGACARRRTGGDHRVAGPLGTAAAGRL